MEGVIEVSQHRKSDGMITILNDIVGNGYENKFVFDFYLFRNYSIHTRRRRFAFMTKLFATTRYTLDNISSP